MIVPDTQAQRSYVFYRLLKVLGERWEEAKDSAKSLKKPLSRNFESISVWIHQKAMNISVDRNF
jgi:hypothetical protein